MWRSAKRTMIEEVAPAIVRGEIEAAQIEHSLYAHAGPAHAGTLGALAYHGAASGLDEAGGDR